MANKFRDGSIQRLLMKNFLTYDHFELFPGSNLNVVLGANGTGKSSILCAICIVLAGKPELTGRGKHVTEYIKHGQNNSIVEIELYINDGNNLVIKREFNRDGKSKWYLQNQAVPEKEVVRRIAKFNIQVNNLCQFLPQDRVKAFSVMNKIELLSSTERAIGEMKLFEQHEKLSNHAKTFLSMQKEIKDKSSQLANEIQMNSQLEDQVRNYQLGKQLDDQINEYKVLVTYVRYKESSARLERIQETLNKIQEECAKLSSKCQPYEKKMNALDAQLKNNENEITNLNNNEAAQLNRLTRNVKDQFQKHEDALDDAKQRYSNSCENNRKIESEVRNLMKHVDTLVEKINQCEPFDEQKLQQEIRELTNEISDNSQLISQVESEKQKCDREIAQIMAEKNRINKAVEEAENTRMKRLQLLQRNNIHVYNAVMWLQNNRDKFQGAVHDPVFSQIDVLDRRYGKYLENTVSNRDLLAFVCENKYDIKLLKNLTDANGWRINILHSEGGDPLKYKPNKTIEELRQIGFDSFIREKISAPDAIMNYMCKNYKIHNVPVSFHDIDLDAIPSCFNLYYMGDKRYTLKCSRYDSSRSTSIQLIRNAYLMTQSQPVPVFNDELRKLNDFNQRLQSLRKKSAELSTQAAETNQNLEKVRETLREKRIFKDPRKKLEALLNRKRDAVQQREAEIVDIDAEKENMNRDIMIAVEKMSEVAHKQTVLSLKITNLTELTYTKKFSLAILKSQKEKIRQQIEELLTQKNQKEEEKDTLTNDRDEYKQHFNTHLRTLKENLNMDDYSYRRQPYICRVLRTFWWKPEVSTYLSSGDNERLKDSHEKKLWSRCKNVSGESSLDSVIMTLLDKEAEANAQRGCLLETDKSIMDEYNRRERKIAAIKEEAEEIQKTINAEVESVSDIKETWVPKIEALATKISDAFCDFMERLNCSGEIKLDKGKDENDFSKYGLLIYVKFRDESNLKEFSEYHQSGGERSVITALYLMALQTLTHVPFRCVDEINQGMDPNNERKMLSMLVESTTQENASQYFLVTPKLLPNIPYNRFVNFLNTWNTAAVQGPNSLTGSKKMTKFYRRRSRRLSQKTEIQNTLGPLEPLRESGVQGTAPPTSQKRKNSDRK